MDFQQIASYLESPNPQTRMKALVELRHHEPEVVVPLLKQRMYDKEFVVRSFVAMGLGNKQTEEGFEALLVLIEHDNDPNVVAESANSLAKFGDRALPHLVNLFEHNSHWLVRQSIFGALEENPEPTVLLRLCQWGLAGDDLVVQSTAIALLGKLNGTAQAEDALAMLLDAAVADTAMIRAQTARALKHFSENPHAKAALSELRHDSNLRVVGAAMESLL